ncbi:MAG: dTMP kinase [Clostridia bacterium]
MKKGFFITIEGCEGSGKTTQIKMLKEFFEKQKIDGVFTKEPGGTVFGEKLREILKHADFEICAIAELLLFESSRAEHMKEVVIPALNANKIVVCDRFVDSSIAYQGYGRGIDLAEIKQLNEIATFGVVPDLTIWLDICPKDAFERKNGMDSGDRIEEEGLAFHDKIYAGFKKICEENPKRVVRIDAKGSCEKVFKDIIKTINKK